MIKILSETNITKTSLVKQGLLPICESVEMKTLSNPKIRYKFSIKSMKKRITKQTRKNFYNKRVSMFSNYNRIQYRPIRKITPNVKQTFCMKKYKKEMKPSLFSRIFSIIN